RPHGVVRNAPGRRCAAAAGGGRDRVVVWSLAVRAPHALPQQRVVAERRSGPRLRTCSHPSGGGGCTGAARAFVHAGRLRTVASAIRRTARKGRGRRTSTVARDFRWTALRPVDRIESDLAARPVRRAGSREPFHGPPDGPRIEGDLTPVDWAKRSAAERRSARPGDTTP